MHSYMAIVCGLSAFGLVASLLAFTRVGRSVLRDTRSTDARTLMDYGFHQCPWMKLPIEIRYPRQRQAPGVDRKPGALAPQARRS